MRFFLYVSGLWNCGIELINYYGTSSLANQVSKRWLAENIKKYFFVEYHPAIDYDLFFELCE